MYLKPVSAFFKAWIVIAALACFGLTYAASEADEAFQKAADYLKRGKLDEGLIELRNTLKADPTHIEARLTLGSINAKRGQIEDAAKEFRRAGQLNADPNRWMLPYGQSLLLQQKFETILEELQPLEELTSKNQASVYSMRGQALMASGRKEEAMASFDEALQVDPDSAYALLGRASFKVEQADLEGALEYLQRAVKGNPDKAVVFLERGELYRNMKRLEEAKADFDTAIALNPNDVRAYVRRAMVLIQLARPDEAIQDVKELRSRTSKRGNFAANYIEALALFQKRNYRKSRDLFQLALGISPDHVQSRLMYGITSYAMNDFLVANEYLSRVFQLVPSSLRVGKMLAATKLKLKEPASAIHVLEELIVHNEDDVQVLTLLGTAYMQAGDNEKGSSYLSKAAELDPDQALLKTQLAIGKLVSGDLDAAVSALEGAVKLDQNVIQADVLLVLTYLREKKFDKALKASVALEKRMPDSPIPLNLTGLAHLAAKDYTKAEEKFLQALDIDKNFSVAKLNRARLRLAKGDKEGAKKIFKEILRDEPDNATAMMGLANMEAEAGHAEASISWLEKAVQVNPRKLQPVMVLSEAYLREKKPMKALSLLNAFDEELELSVAGLRIKGMAQLQAGEFSNAMQTFQTLTNRQSESIEAWFQLGRASAAVKDFDTTRDAFQRAADLDRSFRAPLVWVGLAEAQIKTKELDEALETTRLLQEKFPKLGSGYELAAAILQYRNKVDEALENIAKAQEVEPTSKRINIYAIMLGNQQRWQEAEELLIDWLERFPDDATSQATLAMTYQRQGKNQEAIAAYEQVIKAMPDNPVLLNNIAYLLYLEQDARATDLAARAYELNPERAEIADTYGWILVNSGELQRGTSILQQATILAPNHPEIAYHLAVALQRSGRSDEAKPVLARIVNNTDHKDAPFAIEAKNLLNRLNQAKQ